MFFDLNVKGSSFENNLRFAYEASNYGWDHINFSYNQNDFEDALYFKSDLTDILEDVIGVDYTLEIKSGNLEEIRKFVNKFRKKSNCISVVGGNLKVNRGVVENFKLDVLSRPYLKRFDSGLNHILSREAAYNNVAVELCFNDILKSYLSYRSKVISNFRDIYALYKKFDFPLILSSRAESIFDFRTTHDFMAVFNQIGFEYDDIYNSFLNSQKILDFNKNRDDFIFKGVRRVAD